VYYIVSALKAEAQAFVDRYKLKKYKKESLVYFKNDLLCLVISGVGVENASFAVEQLCKYFPIAQEDIFLNVGICGASKKYDIGALINIDKIIYHKDEFELSHPVISTLHCVDVEISHNIYDIVDMESYGFYKSCLIHNIKNVYVLKIVSDHFEPSMVTKEKTKMLVFKNIDTINNTILKKVL